MQTLSSSLSHQSSSFRVFCCTSTFSWNFGLTFVTTFFLWIVSLGFIKEYTSNNNLPVAETFQISGLLTVLLAIKFRKPKLLKIPSIFVLFEAIIRTVNCLVFSLLVYCNFKSKYQLELIHEILMVLRSISTAASSSSKIDESFKIFGLVWNGLFAIGFFGLFKVNENTRFID